MVSSLGGIPLANPLQNPVMTGLGQYYNAIYSPLQMMAAPLQSLAMASMYGDRGMYYQGAANKDNTQATQMQQGLSGPTGQLVNTILQQGNNSPASIAQAQAVLVAMSQQQQLANQVSSSTVGVNAANAAKIGTQATNLGYGGTVAPTTVTPGPQPGGIVPTGVVTPTQSSQPTGLTPQGNSPGPMLSLQQGLGQLSGSTGQPQTQQMPTYADQMNPQQLAQLASQGASLPPLSAGPLLPGTSKLLGQLDSSPQFNPKLSDQIMLALNPDNQQFVGPEYGIAGARRGYNDILSRAGQASPAYNDFQKMLQNSVLGGEGLANIAAPNTRAASIISKNQALLDPRLAPNPQAYIGNLYNIANMQAQDYSSIIQGRYSPPVRAAAYNQYQQFIKLPGIQQALGLNQQQSSASPQNSTPQTSPSAQPISAPAPGQNPVFDAFYNKNYGGK